MRWDGSSIPGKEKGDMSFRILHP
ncbi:hypothetical protein RCV-Z_ORF42 [Rana catesbeiana virus]|nr:hypothetical protein RCV-Z_ORF42 [Rana catesbeiana virus]